MRLRAFMVGLAGGITSAAVVLVLRLMQPADLSWAPFLYIAAVALVVTAAAGAWRLAERRRTRNSRRIIARFRAAGQDMEADGYFQTGQETTLRADAYDVFEENE